jgi:hypothetical protein
MERAGFTRIATTLGLGALLEKGLVEVASGFDPEWDASYTNYWLTATGMKWLLDNQQRLVLKAEPE